MGVIVMLVGQISLLGSFYKNNWPKYSLWTFVWVVKIPIGILFLLYIPLLLFQTRIISTGLRRKKVWNFLMLQILKIFLIGVIATIFIVIIYWVIENYFNTDDFYSGFVQDISLFLMCVFYARKCSAVVNKMCAVEDTFHDQIENLKSDKLIEKIGKLFNSS